MEGKPKSVLSEKPQAAIPDKCPVCGHKNFELGSSVGSYVPNNKTFSIGSKVVRSIRCLSCNHLMTYVDEAASKRSQRVSLIFFILGVVFLVLFIIVALLPVTTYQ
jgi:hypothetical protein